MDESGHVTALHTGTGMVRALLNTGDYALIAVEVTCDHDHTTRTETPATCTEDGSVTVICDDCGEVLSTETLPATGHTTVVKNAKDATCTEPGSPAIRSAPSAARPSRPARLSRRRPQPKDGKCTVCGTADPNANSGGNTGITAPTAPTPLTKRYGPVAEPHDLAVLAGAVLVLGKEVPGLITPFAALLLGDKSPWRRSPFGGVAPGSKPLRRHSPLAAQPLGGKALGGTASGGTALRRQGPFEIAHLSFCKGGGGPGRVPPPFCFPNYPASPPSPDFPLLPGFSRYHFIF